MSLKHGLLGLLNYGNMTGYDIDRTFKDSLFLFWQAQTSQIYRELNTMEKLGWLTSEIVIQTDKPNKKLYSITGAGKQELSNWLNENSLDNEFRSRSTFLMKLFFSGERSISENIAEVNQDSVYWQLTARFGTLHIKACHDFAEEAIKTLEGLQ